MDAWWTGLDPRLRRNASLGFLWALLFVHLCIVILVPVLLGLLSWRCVVRHRGGQSVVWLGRWILLGSTCLLATLILESAAAILTHRQAQQLAQDLRPAPQALDYRLPIIEQPDRSFPQPKSILVIGESSAAGEPYHPWLSVGQIVAWQAEQRLAPEVVEVQVEGFPGSTLEGAASMLKNIRRRPDIVIIYAGHNEFAARFTWSRTPEFYVDDIVVQPVLTWRDRGLRITPFTRFVSQIIERLSVSQPPPKQITRTLVDRPTCSESESHDVIQRFRSSLLRVVRAARACNAEPILIIPPGNEAEWEPSRSWLHPATHQPERQAFAQRFQAARLLEASDPQAAEQEYLELRRLHPEFAETHYRLGTLWRQAGRYPEANQAFASARDQDGLPLRLPGPLQAVYREVAQTEKTSLIDGPEVLHQVFPDGLLDFRLFHDAQHPSLRGYAALAQAVLEICRVNGLLGLKPNDPPFHVDPARCAAHFGIDHNAWEEICRRSARFFDVTAYTRYDPEQRLLKLREYSEAWIQIRKGTEPVSLGLPGIGIGSAD
jgi:tetratricopeptide (TPR) repeat protein